MITYEQYAKQFAKEKGFDTEVLFQFGISGCTLEEFTKGYAKYAIEAQAESCAEAYAEEYDWSANVYHKIENALIELK